MKTLLVLLLLGLSLPLVEGAVSENLVAKYWPMHDGDTKYYTARVGKGYTRFERQFGSSQYYLHFYEYDEEFEEYDLAYSGIVGYSADRLLEYGADQGWNEYEWDPPLVVLDDNLLASGGNRTMESTISAPGTNIPVSVTLSVRPAGSVTVPAGTFHDCRSVSVRIVDTRRRTLVGTEAYVLAPNVGQIRLAVLSGGSQSGWADLTHGTVGGVDVRNLANQVPPTLTLTSPTKNQRLNSNVTVSGTARDNVRVGEVWVRVNQTAWQLATTTNGWTNWTAAVTLPPGTNTIRAYAVDEADNASAVSTVTVVSVLSAPITLRVDPGGTVTPDYRGQSLEIGRSYTVTAKPDKASYFTGWSGQIVSTNPTLTFVMESNTVLEAHFVGNPFLARQGTYTSLFHQSDDPAEGLAGLLTFKLTAKGAFSGKIFLGARSWSIRGQFALDLRAQSTVSRDPLTPPLLINLRLAESADAVAGSVQDGAQISQLDGYRATFNSTINPATRFAGQYTLALSGGPDGSLSPVGNGFGTLAITAAGLVRFKGSTADGQPVVFTVPLAPNGQWPWFKPLHKGLGTTLGWITVLPAVDSITGAVLWTKSSGALGAYYPDGYTNEARVVGSRFAPPPAGAGSLPLTDAVALLEAGNLTTPLTNEVASVALTGITIPVPNPHKLSLKLNASTGAINGTFLHPQTAKSTPVKGVWLLKQNVAVGFFLGANQGGRFYLGPAEAFPLFEPE